MKIRVLKSFNDKLNSQIEYISRDKPHAARKFKSELLKRVKEIPLMPYKNRKSIFFNRNDIGSVWVSLKIGTLNYFPNIFPTVLKLIDS